VELMPNDDNGLAVDLYSCNDNELAGFYHAAKQWRKGIEEALKKHPLYVMYGERLELISQILTQRLHDTGASAINTPNGTIHTVGQTTARIMDPQPFWEFVLSQRDPAYLDLKANMTACRNHIEETGSPVPGVELSEFRRLSITAPKG